MNEIEDYISQIPTEYAAAFIQLRAGFNAHLPKGFEECLSYGMISYVVPHSLYPKGYHCDTKQQLPFISMGAKKNNITIHHMGLYANPALFEWFTTEYAKSCKYKLDMGKGCFRLKKMDDIPYNLIAELCKKITVDQWINQYEQAFRKN